MTRPARRVPELGLAAVLSTWSGLAAAQEPYTFYGGDIDTERKNPAIEACEYDELVEKQRCNESLNKTACIAEVLEECRARYGDPRQLETRPREPQQSP